VTWLTDRRLANELRWDGRQRGHLEAYTLNVVDPDNDAGWWFRYTLDAPQAQEERSGLWGVHFETGDQPRVFGLKTDFPVRSFGHQSTGFHIRVSQAELTEQKSTGGLRSPGEDGLELRWNLETRHEADPLPVYPKDKHYAGEDPPYKLLLPAPKAVTAGIVETHDERYDVQGARAHQTHAWGQARFAEWTTGHATFFQEKPQAYVYAMLGETEQGHQLGGVQYRDPDGEDLFFGNVETDYEDGPGREPGVWTLNAKTRGWRLSGRFSAGLQRMAGLRVPDPDGTTRYCHHAGIADATIELWKRSWGRTKLEQTLTSRGGAVLEQGGTEPYDDVAFYA